jgi:membrane protein implicated in regulation of membrane protease activity
MPDVGRYRVKGLSPSFCRSPLYVASPLYVGREALGCSEAGVKFRSRGGVVRALDFEIILWAAVATLAFVEELLSISFFLLFFALGATVALVIALSGGGIVAQIVGFVVTSLLSLIVLRPVLTSRLSRRGGERYVSRAVITGKSGIVTNAIEPGARDELPLRPSY